MSKDQLFKADLVHLRISNFIDPQLLASDPTLDFVALAKLRMAEKLAGFIVEHSAKTQTRASGGIMIEINVSIMMAEAPANVNRTKIRFYEAD